MTSILLAGVDPADGKETGLERFDRLFVPAYSTYLIGKSKHEVSQSRRPYS